MLLEFVGREVVQAAMGAHRVVVVPPGLNDHSGLLAGPEPLQRQTLVTQLAVETLIGAVLPRLARVAQRGCNAGLCCAHKFRPATRLFVFLNRT